MKSKLIVFWFILVSVAIVGAAGTNESSSKELNTPPSGKVQFANTWGGTRIPLMEALIKSFNQKHPSIEVVSEVISQAGMNERYLTSIASGTPSDVIMINRNQLPFFASQDALIPLDSLLERDGVSLKDLYYQTEIDLCQWNGKTYALPNSSATGFAIMFWNKKMFADAGLDPEVGPKTWADLDRMNKALFKAQDGNIQQLGLPPSHLPADFITVYLATNNGALFSKDMKKVVINSPEAKETLKWMVSELARVGGIKKLINFYAYAAPTAAVNQGEVISNQAARLAFYNFKTAIQIEGVWGFGQLATEPPNPIDYGACLIPYNSGNPKARHASLVDGGWAYAIPKGAPNAKAAWEFIKFATGEEGAKPFFIAQSGRPTALKTANQDPVYRTLNKYWDVVLADANNAIFSQPLPVSAEIKKIINDEVEKVFWEKSNIDTALDTAQKKAQEVLDKYWAGK